MIDKKLPPEIEVLKYDSEVYQKFADAWEGEWDEPIVSTQAYDSYGGGWFNPCGQRTVVSTGSPIGRHTQIGIDIGTFDGTIDNVNFVVDPCPEVQEDWADRVQFGINFFAYQYRRSIPRLVFDAEQIPPNATIKSAVIKLRALPKPEGLIFDNYNNVPVTIRIFVSGDKAPHMPDQWTHEMCINPRRHDVPLREWGVGGWSDDRWVTTPDLSTIIQEWIDNPPIAPGDAFPILHYFNVYFFICDFESTPVMYRAYDYSDDPASAPILDVWYTLTHTESMDGGCVVGGDTWKLYAEHTKEMTGGVVVGGESWELYGEFVQPMEGGAVISGEWKLFGDHVYPMEGGAVLGGDTCPLLTAPRTLTYPMLGGVVCGGVGYPEGYTWRVKYTVPAGAVKSDLQRFFLGIHFTARPNLAPDFMVTDHAGNRLASELREYDSATGKVWIFFTTDLLADTDNNFWIYYGR